MKWKPCIDIKDFLLLLYGFIPWYPPQVSRHLPMTRGLNGQFAITVHALSLLVKIQLKIAESDDNPIKVLK